MVLLPSITLVVMVGAFTISIAPQGIALDGDRFDLSHCRWVGDFIDRLRQGFVVDMFHLDFMNFAIFNVADSYLTVGVFLLLILMLKEERMEIKIEVAGARLDKALADLTPLSRAVANEQIKEGKVLVNGTVKKAKYTGQRRGHHPVWKFQKWKRSAMKQKICP